MNKKPVKLRKVTMMNKDTIVKLQEDQLNKVKGGKGKEIEQDTEKSMSCFITTCAYCCE